MFLLISKKFIRYMPLLKRRKKRLITNRNTKYFAIQSYISHKADRQHGDKEKT